MLKGATVSDTQTSLETVRLVLKQPIPNIDMHDWEMTAVEVAYPPGGASRPHRHPGLTVAYVIEGSIRSRVADEPERVYSAGEIFIERPGDHHGVSRNASEIAPARLLAVMFAGRGVTPTVFDDESDATHW